MTFRSTHPYLELEQLNAARTHMHAKLMQVTRATGRILEILSSQIPSNRSKQSTGCYECNVMYG